MSSARIGRPPASVWAWSEAHWFTSLPSRAEWLSSTHPEPPASALPIATNSARQRSRLPKSREILPQGRAGLARFAEVPEEQLVQDHRVRGDELLALEAVEDEGRRGGEVEPGEPLLEQVQPLHGAAVVVLVVADDQPLGHALDVLRVAGEGLHGVG